MPHDFTPDDIDWLQDITAAVATVEADAARQEKREAALSGVLQQVDGMRDALAAAHDVTVTWEKEQTILFWKTTRTRSMNWSEANASRPKSDTTANDRNIRDVEVDTRHDLKDGYTISKEDQAKVKEMQRLHQKLVEMQDHLLSLKDDDGNPLFDDRDIRRELWSPLVKGDVIPENAVADRFSEEAQVFQGAVKVYDNLLKEHSATASKYERLQRGLKIAQKTVALAGTAAAQAITIANFSGASMSGQEQRELKALTDQNARTPFEEGSPDAARLSDLTNRYSEMQRALEQQAYAQVAFGLMNGAFDVASQSLEKPDADRNWTIAQTIFESVASAAMSAVGGKQAKDFAEGTATFDARTATTRAMALVKTGLAAGKVVFRIREAAAASDGDRKKFLKAIVIEVGAAIGNAVSAFDVVETRDATDNVINPGTDGAFSNAGNYIRTAVIGAANLTELGAVLVKARDGNIDGKAFAAALGLNVVGLIMAGTYTTAADASRKVLDNSTVSANPDEETEYERSYRKLADGDKIGEIADSMVNLNDLLEAFPGKFPDAAAQEAALIQQAQAAEDARIKAEMTELETRMKNDAAFRAEFEEELRNASEERRAALKDLIQDATPSPDDLADAEASKKAIAAVDKMIAEIEATRTKIAVLDQLTQGAVGMIAKFAPGAGLAVAIRQLVADAFYLAMKAKELNLWSRNMALTYGNDSVYGPAIQSRLASAEIQFSQKTLNAVLSLAGVAAESMRLADVMGAATATTVAITMARALSDYAYDMHKEYEIARGWQLYKDARDNKGDRKAARKAMRWNSTLSKCVLAYGMVVEGDPIAKEVAMNCGLTPVVLKDPDDLCQKVVQYFMAVYNDDPVVLRRIPVAKNWHPGRPVLTLESWLRFKAAAHLTAVPPLDRASTDTLTIDTLLSNFADTWPGGSYGITRDQDFQDDDDRATPEYGAFLAKSLTLARDTMTAFERYVPRNGACPEDAEKPWTEGALHEDMRAITESLAAQAQMIAAEVAYDDKLRLALLADRAQAGPVALGAA